MLLSYKVNCSESASSNFKFGRILCDFIADCSMGLEERNDNSFTQHLGAIEYPCPLILLVFTCSDEEHMYPNLGCAVSNQRRDD